MARMNVFIHNMEAEIGLSDTMNRPAFLNRSRNDYNLSPSRDVAADSAEDVLPVEEPLMLLV